MSIAFADERYFSQNIILVFRSVTWVANIRKYLHTYL